MGYRGKLTERARARELRARSWTLGEIADELDVSTSSVSVWVRDVDFVPRPRNRGHPAGPKHPMRLKKEAELERCRVEAEAWAKGFDGRDLTMFALGLYAGEGDKGGSTVGLANTNARFLRLFAMWLRQEFPIDESRLRAKIYLHEGLDLDAATEALVGGPRRADRPVSAALSRRCRSDRASHQARVRVRHADVLVHVHGEAVVGAHRSDNLSLRQSGIAQLAEQGTVNALVAGSSPAPGATPTGSPCGTLLFVFGAVAQWSEQGTHNPRVVGSIPTRPTTSLDDAAGAITSRPDSAQRAAVPRLPTQVAVRWWRIASASVGSSNPSCSRRSTARSQARW